MITFLIFIPTPFYFNSAIAENKTKDVKNIVSITKQEAMILNKEFNVPYKRYEGISHSYTKNRKYYLSESRYNMNALRKIRKYK